MRRAQSRKALRHLHEKDRGFRLKAIETSAKPPFADAIASLDNGLTVICGLNGVGKTTLLRLVEGTLTGSEFIDERVRPELISDGSFAVTIEHEAEDVTICLGDQQTHGAVLIDAFSNCRTILSVTSQTNYRDLLEGVDPRIADATEVSNAQYVIGKHYDAIRTFEIEVPGTDSDIVVPFFELESDGTTYDVTTMGLGELAAMVALWHIRRVEVGTIVLIEEPETFLSSRSTTALIDVLAKQVVDKRLYAIVTTHSADVAQRVPLDTIRIITPTQSGAQLWKPSSRAELENLLGAYSGQSRLVLVEDETARVFVTEIIGRYQGVWGQSVEVVAAGDAQSVIALCRDFPRVRNVRLLGVLDGDQAAQSSTEWPVKVLPGLTNPDLMLRSAILNSRERFSQDVARSPLDVNVAIEGIQGLDEHDWLKELAEALNIESAQVLRAAIAIWIDQDTNDSLAHNLVDEIVDGLVGH